MSTADSDVVLDAAMEVFRTVLRTGWCQLTELAAVIGRDPHEVLSDWAQANWEAIVEVAIWSRDGAFLEPYGEGADCNRGGSRVWMPEAVPTHAVCCVPRSGTALGDCLTGDEVEVPESGFVVDRFVTLTSNGWYAEEPPFDHVLTLPGGREAMVRLSEVRFVACKLRLES